MADDVNYTVLTYPSHLKATPLPQGQDESSYDPDSDPFLDNKKEDTGSGYNYSDDPRPKGLGDAWIDIPMSQAIEFIPVLTPGELKDIARYKSKVVVARINEQLTTHKEKISLQREKMSLSIATQKEKMSQSLTQHREKMTQQREKMSQTFNMQKVKVSQSLINRKEKMSQHREKMSQSFSNRRERVSQSLSNRKEKMRLDREKMSMRFSLRRDRMSQTLTSQREKMSQSFSIKRDKMTLKSKQVREHMFVGAARVHHMRDQVVTQMKTKFGTGLQIQEFDLEIPVSNLTDIQTSPEQTPVCRRSLKLSQSCPNLFVQEILEPVEHLIPARKDNLSICSYATTVSAQSSESDARESESYESTDSEFEQNFFLSIPIPDIIIPELTPVPAQEIELSLSSSTSSLECPLPPLPKWAYPKHSFPLLKYSQLPDWYKDNECIRKYYRPPLKSIRKCVKSIGYWHSESGNIWSHLLGIILFLFFVPHFAHTMYTRGISDSDFTWVDPTVISIFIFSAVCCLFLSTCFHTFMCHSNNVYVLCLRVDYCGIAVLIIGTYVPWFYYLFYCLRIAQIAYISTSIILGVTAIITMIAPFFNRPKFRIFRALLFGCTGSFGVIPAFHAFGVQGFNSAMSLGGVALMFAGGMFYIVGTGIYAIRLPERIFPGKCDLLLQSHTIFHICVLIAATFHYFSLLHIQHIRLLRGGFCNAEINI